MDCLKNEEIYNIFDTDKLLNRPVVVAVTKTSGVSGVAHWINSYFKLSGESAVDKKHPVVMAVKEWVDDEYESGRVVSIADNELIKIIREKSEELGIELAL